MHSIGLKGFNIINLQGDKLITLKDLIETSQEILNKEVIVEESDSNNISIRNVSNQMAFQMLSWQPKIDLEEGLKRLNNFLSTNK